jgi:hypothetical protein
MEESGVRAFGATFGITTGKIPMRMYDLVTDPKFPFVVSSP